MNNSEIPSVVIPNISMLNKKINTITLEKTIGRGAHGIVYSCRDDNNQQLAVKCIKVQEFGIPSLIEASIMSSIQHPNLSQALKIHLTLDKLYIIQELAISDLKIYRLKHEIPTEILYNWIYMIVQGISCLHSRDIIHGDIKSSNILVYNDGKVKLTDFTLSTNINWINKYHPCTASHRPLEVWLNKRWNKSIDIWSLGCTIFETFYKSSLFPTQNKDESINALLDWYNFIKIKHSISHRPVFHYTFSLPDTFNQTELINNLIMSLLTEEKNRPTIDEILNNNFSNYYVPGVTQSPIMNIQLMEATKTERTKFLVWTNNDEVIKLACNLYSRLNGIMNSKDKIKRFTCCYIGYKMIYRKNISLDILPYSLNEITQMEVSICNYLFYKLF